MDARLATLTTYAEQIASLDRLRAGLVSDADDLIESLRRSGVGWPDINRALGTANVQVSFERRRRARTVEPAP